MIRFVFPNHKNIGHPISISQTDLQLSTKMYHQQELHLIDSVLLKSFQHINQYLPHLRKHVEVWQYSGIIQKIILKSF